MNRYSTCSGERECVCGICSEARQGRLVRRGSLHLQPPPPARVMDLLARPGGRPPFTSRGALLVAYILCISLLVFARFETTSFLRACAALEVSATRGALSRARTLSGGVHVSASQEEAAEHPKRESGGEKKKRYNLGQGRAFIASYFRRPRSI